MAAKAIKELYNTVMIEKLISLTQEGTVHDYCDVFEEVYNKVEIEEDYAVYLFIAGLNPEISELMMFFHNIDSSLTLQMAFTIAKVKPPCLNVRSQVRTDLESVTSTEAIRIQEKTNEEHEDEVAIHEDEVVRVEKECDSSVPAEIKSNEDEIRSKRDSIFMYSTDSEAILADFVAIMTGDSNVDVSSPKSVATKENRRFSINQVRALSPNSDIKVTSSPVGYGSESWMSEELAVPFSAVILTANSPDSSLGWNAVSHREDTSQATMAMDNHVVGSNQDGSLNSLYEDGVGAGLWIENECYGLCKQSLFCPKVTSVQPVSSPHPKSHGVMDYCVVKWYIPFPCVVAFKDFTLGLRYPLFICHYFNRITGPGPPA